MPRSKELKHYWICGECALAKGGVFPEDHVCTVSLGDCPYCGQKDVTIIPIVDFDWKGWKTEEMRD